MKFLQIQERVVLIVFQVGRPQYLAPTLWQVLKYCLLGEAEVEVEILTQVVEEQALQHIW